MNKMLNIAAAIIIGVVVSTGTALAQNKVVIDGSTTVGPIAKAFAEYYMKQNQGLNIIISESGSGNGAKSLINSTCDIAMMSRPMKSTEIKSAENAGVSIVENVVAMDGIAMIVHPSNPVQNLTMDQIKCMYLGEIKNWKELGGADAIIVVISRETNSGTYETFENMVLNKEKIAGRVEYVGSNGAARQRVLNTEGAIAYVGLAFTERVKVMQVNGVLACEETVRSGEYGMARPLYMYTNGRPEADSHVCNFLGMAKTIEGKRIVDDLGFVSLTQGE